MMLIIRRLTDASSTQQEIESTSGATSTLLSACASGFRVVREFACGETPD